MPLPLTGIHVLDFTRHLPGPYATDLLRRLGAEIIKIEPPDGDPTRWLPPVVGEYGALFTLINEGKESVVVDLKSEEGRAFVHRLAANCDVAIEGYRPGVAKQFAVDAETLMAINPRLVYCSISGFGEENQVSGHDLNFVALAGLLDLQRDASGKPILPATQIGDMGGALFGALSVVAALFEAAKTGRGRNIDISMSDATRALMPTAEALYRGTHEKPSAFMLTGALPSYNVYQTADGKYLAIAPLEPQFWKAFCHAIGRPDFVEKQYEAAAKAQLFEGITQAIRGKTRAEWEAIFAPIDACVSPVLSIEEAHARFGDPMDRHPLQKNFPAPSEDAPELGTAFDRVAAAAGYSRQETEALKKTRKFDAKSRLQQFITTSVLKLRQKKYL